jgi:hypothetical protein
MCAEAVVIVGEAAGDVDGEGKDPQRGLAIYSESKLAAVFVLFKRFRQGS